jgi:uncharacterized membrane protein YdfJ with MMPL/SSD domain
VHLAGQFAINVDQQAKSGSTGNQVEGLSVIFILVLLLLIFRSLLAPLITLIPAFLAVAISGPLVAEAAHAGLKVSQLAQLMMIVLVLGAGTDYGLFLVFRVRENLRDAADPKDAVRSALTRVGETITFSALTVIAALLSLSRPVWNNPDPVNAAVDQLTASGLFTGVTGPLNPAGVTLTPGAVQVAARHAGGPPRSRRSRRRARPACRWFSTRPTGPPRSTSAPTARRSSS